MLASVALVAGVSVTLLRVGAELAMVTVLEERAAPALAPSVGVARQ